MRTEHPLIVALVEAFARRAGVEPAELWDALDGKPADPKLVAGLVEAFHPTVRRSDFQVLPSVSDNARIDTPMQPPTQREFQGPPPTKNKATEKLRKLGVSIAEAGATCGVTYSAARSWFQQGRHGRTVPAKHFATLKREYGIVASDLPNGVAEK